MFGLDDIFDGIGSIVEGTVEAVTRLPEIPIKIVEGTFKGVEKGFDKIGDAMDKLDN